MNIQESMIVLKAIEFMSYGIDISKFKVVEDYKQYVNNKNEIITRLSPTVKDFVWELDEGVKKILDTYENIVVRKGKTFYQINPEEDEEGYLEGLSTNIKVTEQMVWDTMKILYKTGVCSFSDIDPLKLDDELLKRLEEMDKAFNRLSIPNTDMVKKLTKEATKRNFGILTSLTYKDYPEVRDRMLDAYDKVYTHFDLNKLKDFPVVDNRLYIQLSLSDWHRIKEYYRARGWAWDSYNESMKYVVVSKNLYDYYFCSQGSEFQSCYSLTSNYRGWCGMHPFGTFDSHYIIYGSKEDVTKYATLNDNNKWQIPYMFFRHWGWTSTEGDLLVDKCYTGNNTRAVRFAEAVRKTVMADYMIVDYSGERRDTKEGKAMQEFFNRYEIGFYPDSVYVGADFRFSVSNGNRHDTGCKIVFNNMPERSLATVYLQNITNVSDTFNPKKDFAIVQGKLINPKICPVTKLLIDETESVSKYAKYLNNPIEGEMLVATYCDGYFKLDAATREGLAGSFGCRMENDTSTYGGSGIVFRKNFNGEYAGCDAVPLKTFKEKIKELIDKSAYDLVLLRVIEDDKVNFIKYKKKGVKA